MHCYRSVINSADLDHNVNRLDFSIIGCPDFDR